MPSLHKLLSIAGETPSFLLPVFRVSRGANQELVQKIGDSDLVVAFEPVLTENAIYQVHEGETAVEIGQPAIWAFRDHKSHIHIGTSVDIKRLGIQLLSSRALDKYPLAAAELASFCGVESEHPEILREAFKALTRHSKRSAEVWRDCTVLLPNIKQEWAAQMPMARNFRKEIGEIQAITIRSTTHIFASVSILDNAGKLSRSFALARLFGIKAFKLHIAGSLARFRTSEEPLWTLVGMGRAARLAMNGPPFFGTPLDHSARSDGTVAYSPTRVSRQERHRTLLIGLVPSDLESVAFSNHIAKGSTAAYKHAINIRPIGFGTPRRDKPPPRRIQQALTNFDFIWIQANHRQKQTGNFASSLSASNSAARLARAAALSLIECLQHREARQIIGEANHPPRLGLFGTTQFSRAAEPDILILRTLHSMLCEDALLHSAKRIVVLWPSLAEEEDTKRLAKSFKVEKLRLGMHEYKVEVLVTPRSTRLREIISLAIDVQLSPRSERHFRDFCLSIISGYGFRFRRQSSDNILLENDGGPLRIWPVTSNGKALELLNRNTGLPLEVDWIVSNQTVTQDLQALARANDTRIIHYSEIGRLMKSEYSAGVFKDY